MFQIFFKVKNAPRQALNYSFLDVSCVTTLFCHSRASIPSLPIITLTSLRVLILITLQFCAVSFSLFLSKNMVCTVLYSLDNDSPHYFAGHRQQCHTTPIFALFQVSSFCYFHYQTFLPLFSYLLMMPCSI